MAAAKIAERISLWETVAAVQIIQAAKIGDVEDGGLEWDRDTTDLFKAAQICPWSSPLLAFDKLSFAPGKELKFSQAYRQMDSTKLSYQEVLARASGFDLKGDQIKGPQFPNLNLQPSENGGIVICPGEINDAFKMPYTVWKAVIGQTRSYGAPVSLLGGHGIRYDFSSVTEASILSEMALEDRVRAIASAKLIVGVPNEWTWIGMGLGKKVIVFYPDDIPWDRWSGFQVEKRSMGRLLYTRAQIQIPILLSGLRKLIDVM